jgi:transcriptional regulator with XRE-family HTH domain
MQFGRVIKESRKAKGLTQSQLGSMVEKTQGQISEWEKDITEPSSEDKIKLCKALNLSLAKFYGIEDDFDIVIEVAKDKGLSPEDAIKAIEMYLIYSGK